MPGIPALRVVEVDVDTTGYDQGPPGGLDFPGIGKRNYRMRFRRDLQEPKAFEDLLGKAGISPSTTGRALRRDNNNWFAAWAFWPIAILRVMKKFLLMKRPAQEVAGGKSVR